MDSSRTCPTCGAIIPVDPLFTPWCDACGWNLVPTAPTHVPARLETARLAFAKRVGEELAAEVRANGPRRPRLTLSTAAAYAICAGVYAFIALLLWAGLSTLAAGQFTPLGIVVIGLSLVLTIAMIPRPNRVEGDVLTRADLPACFALMDGLTEAFGGARIDGIVIDEDLNASYGRYGLRLRRIVTIGLPLYAVLDPSSRIAVLGHELGHGLNGDPTRGVVMGGALNALLQLHQVLEPDELFPSEDGLSAIIGLPFRLAQLGLSRIALGMAYVLLLLQMRASQRAEYYADAIGIRAAGRSASLTAFEQMAAARVAFPRVSMVDMQDPIATFVEKAKSIPPREIVRQRRIERLRGSHLYHTHPPSAYRVDVIAAEPENPPAVEFDSDLWERIDAELAPIRGRIGRLVVDARQEAATY